MNLKILGQIPLILFDLSVVHFLNEQDLDQSKVEVKACKESSLLFAMSFNSNKRFSCINGTSMGLPKWFDRPWHAEESFPKDVILKYQKHKSTFEWAENLSTVDCKARGAVDGDEDVWCGNYDVHLRAPFQWHPYLKFVQIHLFVW